MATGYIGNATGSNGDGTYSTGLTMTNTYPTSVSISPAGGYYIATYWGQLTYYLSASGCTDVELGTQSLHRDDGRTGDVTVDNSSAPYAPTTISATLSGSTATQFAGKALSIRVATGGTGTLFHGRMTVTVNTAPYTYGITATSVANGYIGLSATSATPGTTVTVTPYPNSGYRLESLVSGQVTLTRQSNGTYTFTMPSTAVTITPTFVLDVYTLTLTQATGGTITASKTGSVAPGTTITLTNTPATGYTFGNYSVGGTAQTASSFTMPSRNITVTAVFNVNTTPPTFTPNVEALLSDNTVSSMHIKGVTRLHASITNASAATPKTIASYLISVSGYGSSASASYTTSVMNSAGVVPITYTVTDSNGNYNSVTSRGVTVWDYAAPSLNVSFFRCSDSSGTESAVGTYIGYRATADCTSLDSTNSIQSATATISGSGTWNLTLDGAKHVLDNYNLPATQYTDVSVAVSDLYKTTTNTIRIPTSNFAIHLSSDGTSIAFGKAVEHTNSFEIDGGRTVYIGAKTLSQYSQVLKLTSNTFSSLPVTINNSSITADMEVVQYVLSNPAAQTSDWTWTTAAGSITLSNGTISGSTQIDLYLAETFS